MKRILTSLILILACAAGFVVQADVELIRPDGTKQTYDLSYKSLQDIINEDINKAGEWTIKLTSDVEVSQSDSIYFGKDYDATLTIDLNGHKLSIVIRHTGAIHEFLWVQNRCVVIDDTSATANGELNFLQESFISFIPTFMPTLYDMQGIWIGKNGALEIRNGTVSSNQAETRILIKNEGFLKIDGENTKIKASENAKALQNDGVTIIRNGTFEGSSIDNVNGFLGIFNGIFYTTVKNQQDAKILITDGAFKPPTYDPYTEAPNIDFHGVFEIRGGWFATNVSLDNNGVGYISGGNFPTATSMPDRFIEKNHQWRNHNVEKVDSSLIDEPYFAYAEYDNNGTVNVVNRDQLSNNPTVQKPNVVLLGTFQSSGSTLTFDYSYINKENNDNRITLDLNGYYIDEIKVTLDVNDPLRPLQVTGPGRIPNLSYSQTSDLLPKIPVITKRTSAEVLLKKDYAWDANGRMTFSNFAVTKNGTEVGFVTLNEAIAYAPGEEVTLMQCIKTHESVSQNVRINLSSKTIKLSVASGVTCTLAGTGTLESVIRSSGSVIQKDPDASIALESDLSGCYWSADHILSVKGLATLTAGDKTTEFMSLSDALDAVPTDGNMIAEIVLQNDDETTNWLEIKQNQRVRLDFNGNCLTRKFTVRVREKGLLVLCDSGTNWNPQVCIIVNDGTLGIEGGKYSAYNIYGFIYLEMYSRLWIEGGEFAGSDSCNCICFYKGEAQGVEIRGGHFGMRLLKDETASNQLRILGGEFSQDPSAYVIGARTVTQNEARGLYVVGDAKMTKVQSDMVQMKLSSLETGKSLTINDVGVLTRTNDGGTLKPESPFVAVQGASVSLRKADETVTSGFPTSDDDTVEANKKMLLLNAAYDVTTGANGKTTLDYVYDFTIDAFSVVSLPCDDPLKERHELRFTMGLREGEMRKSRTVTLDNAKVLVMCNDEKLPVVLEKPSFTNGVCEFVTIVETDKTDGRAKLFRLKLDSLTIK